jgi:hypothetical protein
MVTHDQVINQNYFEKYDNFLECMHMEWNGINGDANKSAIVMNVKIF